MLRINQLAKELGVPNHDILDVAEKRLGLTGKSHSSNLTDDQAAQIRRVVEGKGKGGGETAPLGMHKPAAAVKVVKVSKGEPAAEAPKAEAPKAEPPRPAPSVLVKKAEPRLEAPVAPSAASPAPEAPAAEAPRASLDPEGRMRHPGEAAAPAAPAAAPKADEGFSRLKISATPAPAPKAEEKPARYIQLPQAPVKREGPSAGTGPKPEAGARPVLQRPGQPSHVQRSGERQQEKAVLPMASNTSRGEVKHEPALPPPGKRPYIPPSINQMRSEGGFSKISISDTPAPAPRPSEPARYIQLPQARPVGGARPAGTGYQGNRPSGPGGPGRGPGGPGRGPGGPGRGPGGPRPGGFGGPRPGGPGGRPGMGGAPTGPIDPNAQKGPGRGAHGAGNKKKKGYTKEQEEMDLKLRQPRSRSQQIATEYVEDEIGIVMLSE
ncbi:MAG TPA: translation initiation factor IF-2 N-terminal domain-containing protein, partial [Holophagaceae bacterium]|nr:translation initiation factor IF-2 N-terminal domain-containing protein [Holophagaceae bacterium]